MYLPTNPPPPQALKSPARSRCVCSNINTLDNLSWSRVESPSHSSKGACLFDRTSLGLASWPEGTRPACARACCKFPFPLRKRSRHDACLVARARAMARPLAYGLLLLSVQQVVGWNLASKEAMVSAIASSLRASVGPGRHQWLYQAQLRAQSFAPHRVFSSHDLRRRVSRRARRTCSSSGTCRSAWSSRGTCCRPRRTALATTT